MHKYDNFSVSKESLKSVTGLYSNQIINPMCGSGGFLLDAIKSLPVIETNHLFDNLIISKQIINQVHQLNNNAINNENLFLNNKGYDNILCHPPYVNYIDFIVSTVKNLSKHGRACLLLPQEFLNSGNLQQANIREFLVRADLIECIISLPEKFEFYKGIPGCIVTISRIKKIKLKNKVLFINANQVIQSSNDENNINILTSIYQDWCSDLKENYKDVLTLCKSINIEKLADNNYVLTPGNYVTIDSNYFSANKEYNNLGDNYQASNESKIDFLSKYKTKNICIVHSPSRIEKAYFFERTNLENFLNQQESKNYGVYILTGKDSDNEEKIYIGQSNNLSNRLRQHLKDKNKYFWNKTFFITTKDNSFNRGQTLYLEKKIIELALQSKKMVVTNVRKEKEEINEEFYSLIIEDLFKTSLYLLEELGLKIL